jgi:peptide/nickel transport system ATP-binding protein
MYGSERQQPDSNTDSVAAHRPLLSVRGLSKDYPVKRGSGRHRMMRAVDGLSFDVLPGETVSIVGESGCGKSTTLRLILALLDPSAGEVWFDGQRVGSPALPLKQYRRQVQMVFQDSYASLNPRLSAEEAIAFPSQVHGATRKAAIARAHELLDAVGLSPAQHGRRYPHQLSGGQRQRINIARALALQPRLLILDEPVSALDKSVEAQILNLLADLKAQFKLTYLLVSHDLGVVHYVSDRVIVMYLGRSVESGPVDAIYDAPAHPYTAALLASRPSLDPDRRRTEPPLSGDPPSPLDPPSGCYFRTRCVLAQEVCATRRPALDLVAPGHRAACLVITPGSGHTLAPPARA